MKPDRVVWIFGSSRTGSTWLSDMMGDSGGQVVWREPLIGALFGQFYYQRAPHRAEREGGAGEHFIMGGKHAKTWLGPMRDMVLTGGAARFPEAAGGAYLVIKEPNGSMGAPLLLRALPESRLVLLVRDPRDVVASSMDARLEGSWRAESRQNFVRKGGTLDPGDLDRFVKTRARLYAETVTRAKQAYDAHEGRKALVRYEELRADTLGTMRRMYSELAIAVDDGQLARAVDRHSWECIPDDQKGAGKFYRRATPGGWREDLTPEQAKIVEKITTRLLEELYPEESTGGAPSAAATPTAPRASKISAPSAPAGARKRASAAPLAMPFQVRRSRRSRIRRATRRLPRRLLRASRPPGEAQTPQRMDPANLVWIFGTGRTGSTWVTDMMAEVDGHSVWFEPRVGELFAVDRARGHHHILHPKYRRTWLGSIRGFVLDGAEARFPALGSRDHLVVKDPGGSPGAPLVMQALPESRMVLLVRDPRDVVASWLDASRSEGW